MFYGRDIPEWEVGEFDLAYLEGRDESHFNNVGLCPKCGTVCARDWCCECCGSDLERCSPRLRIALSKRPPSRPEPGPKYWRLPAGFYAWEEESEVIGSKPRLKKRAVGLFAFRFVNS